MASKNADYYRVRAAEERLRAAYVADSLAVIHLRLAEKYEALIEVDERRTGLRSRGDGIGLA